MFLLVGGSARTEPVGGMWNEVEHRVKRYIAFKFILSAITGVLSDVAQRSLKKIDRDRHASERLFPVGL